MRKKIVYLCVILFLINSNTSISQEIKRVKISDFYFSPSTFISGTNRLDRMDVSKLANNSNILKGTDNFSDFDNNTYTGSYGRTDLHFLLGFTFSDKEKTKILSSPHLRIGLSYGNNLLISNNFSKEQIHSVDTLNSQNTNRQTFVDSVVTENYFVNYETENIRLDASIIFRRKPEERWSVYAGLGVMTGVSIQSNTDIFYQKNAKLRYNYENTTNNINHEFLVHKNEKFENKMSFSFATYLPLGVNFRIGNKREFWKHTHLYYELRPGVILSHVPELGTFTNTFLQQGIGLKFSW